MIYATQCYRQADENLYDSLMEVSFFSKLQNRTRSISLCALLSLSFPSFSWATGSPSGTVIRNQASVDYVIGTSPATSSPSNFVDLVVDKKINLLVAETTGSATLVSAGQTGAITTFTVTNLGNDPQDFLLTATLANGNPAVNGIAPFTLNDFNATGRLVYVDVNDNGLYEPTIDTATSITGLNADASKTVFIISNIPSTINTGQQSVVSLTATATALGGSALSATLGADTLMNVDTVFTDIAGVSDGARDAQHSAYAAYLSNAVNVTLNKTIVSVQPASGAAVSSPATGDPALRPGSVLTYQIVASFSGIGSIDNLVITDPLPADTTFVPGSILVNGTPQTDTIDPPTDNTDFTGNVITVNRGQITTPASNVVIQFKATIN